MALGDDGATPAGELGLEGVPGTAPGALGDPGEEGKLFGRLYGRL